MTNLELREALKKEIEMPHKERMYTHPSLDDFLTEFVDYSKDGQLTLSYPLKPSQRNGYKLLQGGLIAAFFDTNFGIFANVSTGAKSMPTVNLSVNYHKAVLEDTDRIWITTRVISAGKRILSMAGEARNAEGRLLATCQTNMLNAENAYISI